MEDGEDVPYEGDPDEALLHASGGTGGTTYPVFVSVDLPDGSERVNVYLPKHLISRVDRFAGQYGMNRSSVFGNAIRRYLETENDPKFWEKKVEEVLRKSG